MRGVSTEFEAIVVALEALRLNDVRLPKSYEHLNDDGLLLLLVGNNIRFRDQLERLFGGVWESDAVIGRLEGLYRDNAHRVEASDRELVAFARGHIQEMRSVVTAVRERAPELMSAVEMELFDRVAQFDVEVTSGNESEEIVAEGVEISGTYYGDWEEPGGEIGDVLSPQQVRSWVGADANLFEVERDLAISKSNPLGLRDVGERIARPFTWLYRMCVDMCESHRHVGQHVCAPGVQTEIDYSHYYNLWRSGCRLWLLPDRLVVQRESVPPWPYQYVGLRPTRKGLFASPTWLATAGPMGPGVLDALEEAHERELQSLTLEDAQLLSLPPNLAQLQSVTRLRISGSPSLGWPDLTAFENLASLSLDNCGITEIPDSIRSLRNLKALALDKNRVTELPQALFQLPLHYLSINANELSELDPAISQLSSLKELRLDNNIIVSLPPQIGNLHDLEILSVERNQLAKLPAAIGSLTKLEQLYLRSNPITELPPDLLQLDAVSSLTLPSTHLPEMLHKAKNISELRAAWQ